ncbi:MAG: non-canonical purine NTP pyrophosphatase [bacterium]
MKITFITGNAGKAEEVSRYLGLEIDHHSLDLEEIQSLDLEEIVKDKALRAYSKIGKPVLVEDVSFVFHALGKLPGPLIKWFLKELENEGLCRLIDGKDRRCTAKVCYGFCDGETVHLFDGSMSGTISDSPKGTNSFGWSSIFIPDGYDKTYAEMLDEERSSFAMRNIALKSVREFMIQNAENFNEAE